MFQQPLKIGFSVRKFSEIVTEAWGTYWRSFSPGKLSWPPQQSIFWHAKFAGFPFERGKKCSFGTIIAKMTILETSKVRFRMKFNTFVASVTSSVFANPVQEYVSPQRMPSADSLRRETQCEACMRIMRSYRYCKLNKVCNDYTERSI